MSFTIKVADISFIAKQGIVIVVVVVVVQLYMYVVAASLLNGQVRKIRNPKYPQAQ